MTKQLGIAIIGCGYWGINYVRVFNELPGSQVVAVCDAREERLQEVARQFPGVALSTEVEEVLQLEGVDAAVVCTGATTHYEVAHRCLTAGKHILVEKPLTTEGPDAEKLIALAEAKTVTLMVGHTFLYNPGVRKVKEYMSQGKAGHIYYLYAQRTNLGPIRHDVNALWDLAPHDISIFNYLLDDVPQWVSAVGAKVLQNHREDVGFVSLGYQNGIVGHIHVSWADPNKVRETVVVGSDKRIVFNDLKAVERVRIYEKGVAPAMVESPAGYGEYPFHMRDGDIISPRVEVSEPLKNQCGHFIDCVNQGCPPLTDGQAGLEVVQVMSAINQSIAHNGAPISVDSAKPLASMQLNGSSVKVMGEDHYAAV